MFRRLLTPALLSAMAVSAYSPFKRPDLRKAAEARGMTIPPDFDADLLEVEVLAFSVQLMSAFPLIWVDIGT